MLNNQSYQDLLKICQKMQYNIAKMTTIAGSGHPSSSLSGVELMCVLMHGQINGKKIFNCDYNNFENAGNDRIIFSKGHASALFYAMYNSLNLISDEDLWTYRKFDSVLEGHPTPRFKYTEATTGSLGLGLGIGLGMAFASRIDGNDNKIWVLMGDSEIAEGSIWEAIQLTSFYKMKNIIGIIDMNRLGQRGQTMLGWDCDTLKKRIEAFGWNCIVIEDGHDINQVFETYRQLLQTSYDGPTMIIARTRKGNSINIMQDQDNWHGKVMSQEQFLDYEKSLIS
jgi:transketolase